MASILSISVMISLQNLVISVGSIGCGLEIDRICMSYLYGLILYLGCILDWYFSVMDLSDLTYKLGRHAFLVYERGRNYLNIFW